MPSGFRINQALFGYRAGHHLLASSAPLSTSVRQFLANATDGSGPETPGGFEEPETGLPIPDTSFYAVFKTWSAPEMPRPGCVWSHVLIISFVDLAQIPDLSTVRGFFRRPSNYADLSEFECPLFLSGSALNDKSEHVDLQRAELVLSLLYGQPDQSVVILDHDNEKWGEAIFQVWSQQWPRLRRSFSFSTGSLGDRRSTGANFDLQIAPANSLRLWKRNSQATTLIDFESSRPPALSDDFWLRAALDDLRSDDISSPLRVYLAHYGAEVALPRKAFAPLVRFLPTGIIQEHLDPPSILAELSLAFPASEEALTLKRDYVNAFLNNRETDSAWAIAYFLLLAPRADAFSKVDVDFRSNARSFWDIKRADVLAVLGNLREESRAQEFIAAIAEAVSPENIPYIWNEQPSILDSIVRFNLRLACAPSAWELSRTGQEALWHSVRQVTSDSELWSEVLTAMLAADCCFAEEETLSLAGQYLDRALVEWCRSPRFHPPSARWRRSLSVSLSRVLQESDSTSALLALAVSILPSNVVKGFSGHRRDVQNLALNELEKVPKPILRQTLFWLLAIGLQTDGPDGLVLIRTSLFEVYDAVARSEYSREAWDILSPVLPEGTWGLDWDRCRRIRNGLKRWLRYQPQFKENLLQAAPSNASNEMLRLL